MTPAYSSIYVDKCSRTIGSMLHAAVYEFGYTGNEFLKFFIQSGIASEIENGNPKYLAGKSGLEIFCDVMEIITGYRFETKIIEIYARTDAYWVGWILARYQQYSGKQFRDILEVLPYDELIGLYDTLHEADVRKSYEVFDKHFESAESKLKKIRRKCGLSQQQLADRAGVSINTIRAYERKSKDINKAQIDILLKLSGSMKCSVEDIVD